MASRDHFVLEDSISTGNEFLTLFKSRIITGGEGIGNCEDWKIISDRYCIQWERRGDISIIALMVHIINDMPIYFEAEHLIRFHEKVALSLIENKWYL